MVAAAHPAPTRVYVAEPRLYLSLSIRRDVLFRLCPFPLGHGLISDLHLRASRRCHGAPRSRTLVGEVAKWMQKISYSGYRLPPEIIQQAIWLYLRFTLSLRDVEDLLAERGITVSYETVRRFSVVAGLLAPAFAAERGSRRAKEDGREEACCP
jgi:hypothetical protein